MITAQNLIDAPLEKVWQFWTLPEHIVKWNSPSPDWHTPVADNDLKVGGKFKYVMKAKDGSEEFDFEGLYTNLKSLSLIEYKLFDDRAGSVYFDEIDGKVKITEIFEPEKQISESMQRQWCQAVIDNFKAYVEAS
ncbi:SRPBCC domain-containing protein [Flavobacterium limi]|uniref:Activator of HSP90 ATPase n=1 Tax=Flavobacterium limi TaxID=2045105 RepID=A0ABQ1TKI3_9FLAO|nr:SRPBCC domain-containing protein [Flavobacterium limi]GGE97518.1 activator of HSP90 ATPase [Flavobacterium limi]